MISRRPDEIRLDVKPRKIVHFVWDRISGSDQGDSGGSSDGMGSSDNLQLR
jgi:hypothetical protein